MKMPLILSAAACLAITIGCNQKPAATEEKKEMTTTESAMVNVKVADLVNDKDLRCGMTVEDGSIADTASYEGKLYGFCSKECKADFVKDPQTYIAQK